MSLPVILMFLGSIVFQVFALSLLPITQGFTKVAPTVGCMAAFIGGIGLLARIIVSGVPLSILIPVTAAVVPLGVVVVGVAIYGEPASLMRIVTLISACGLIGVASRL